MPNHPATNPISNLPSRHVPPHHNAKMVAYPDYNKSLIQQRHPHPVQEGAERAVQTGLTGAALGGLIARLLTEDPKKIGIAAGAAGLASAVPGFISGHGQARSDYTKLLYLRRTLGIKDPGELDALLQNPGLVDELVAKTGSVKKSQAARIPIKTVLKALGVIGAAGAGGYALGSEGTSRLIGYHDDPAARHVGGYVNAANASAVAAALFAARHGHPEALKALIHPGALGGMAGMEVIPSVLRSANRMADASQAQADKLVAPSVGRALSSPTARGAGVGLGLAGLASIATGLMRPKSEQEIQKHRSRAGMVTRDFLRAAVPAALGGGLVGSLAKE